MARTFNRTERLYTPAVYGPFSVDSFTRNDTDALKLTLTQVDWPENVKIMDVTLAWDTGEFAKFDVWLTRDINGNIRPSVSFVVSVPRARENGVLQKRGVASGAVTIDLHQSIRTAISLEAIAFSVAAQANGKK